MLAATLGATYGIYGPAVRAVRRHARAARLGGVPQFREVPAHCTGTSTCPWSLRDYITRVNEIRRDNPALHHNRNLRFFEVDNDSILCYGKSTPDMTNLIVVVVNLDPYHTQTGWVRPPGARAAPGIRARGVVPGARPHQRRAVPLERHQPTSSSSILSVNPAHILRVRRKIRTEHDFDYFM